MTSRPTLSLSKATPTQWYCVVVGVFLLVRSVTTLIGDPDFGLPGSGWRASLQLVVAVVLLGGIRRYSVQVVAGVGGLYAAETLLGIIGGGAILGVVPVDMRDRFVHPILAVVAALVVFAALQANRTRQKSTATE